MDRVLAPATDNTRTKSAKGAEVSPRVPGAATAPMPPVSMPGLGGPGCCWSPAADVGRQDSAAKRRLIGVEMVVCLRDRQKGWGFAANSTTLDNDNQHEKQARMAISIPVRRTR